MLKEPLLKEKKKRSFLIYTFIGSIVVLGVIGSFAYNDMSSRISDLEQEKEVNIAASTSLMQKKSTREVSIAASSPTATHGLMQKKSTAGYY